MNTDCRPKKKRFFFFFFKKRAFILTQKLEGKLSTDIFKLINVQNYPILVPYENLIKALQFIDLYSVSGIFCLIMTKRLK